MTQYSICYIAKNYKNNSKTLQLVISMFGFKKIENTFRLYMIISTFKLTLFINKAYLTRIIWIKLKEHLKI